MRGLQLSPRVENLCAMYLHAHGLLQVGALHLLPLDAEAREARVLAVAREVVQEVVDNRRRDDITDVLRVLVFQRLQHSTSRYDRQAPSHLHEDLAEQAKAMLRARTATRTTSFPCTSRCRCMPRLLQGHCNLEVRPPILVQAPRHVQVLEQWVAAPALDRHHIEETARTAVDHVPGRRCRRTRRRR